MICVAIGEKEHDNRNLYNHMFINSTIIKNYEPQAVFSRADVH
jgi:hypothetical protein